MISLVTCLPLLSYLLAILFGLVHSSPCRKRGARSLATAGAPAAAGGRKRFSYAMMALSDRAGLAMPWMLRHRRAFCFTDSCSLPMIFPTGGRLHDQVSRCLDQGSRQSLYVGRSHSDPILAPGHRLGSGSSAAPGPDHPGRPRRPGRCPGCCCAARRFPRTLPLYHRYPALAMLQDSIMRIASGTLTNWFLLTVLPRGILTSKWDDAHIQEMGRPSEYQPKKPVAQGDRQGASICSQSQTGQHPTLVGCRQSGCRDR